MHSALLRFRSSNTLVLGSILGLACTMMPGCESVGPRTLGQKYLVPPDHVRVVHSEQHCEDVDTTAATPFPDADHVESVVWGASVLLSLSGSEWTWTARQMAVERDADLSLIRPCDGEGSFKYAQIELWRTRDFSAPTLQDAPPPESGTLMAPAQSTYGARLRDIFECFEQARVTRGQVTPENGQRLGGIDATGFFTASWYFPGYARIDKYYRPTRTGDLSLTGILLDRPKADWAANVYLNLSPDGKSQFADQYLVCLLDRGYAT